jgi:hypothetical protein
MRILDSRGRLFGKISILDLGALCVILLAIVGIFFFPGTNGSVAQVKETKPVEVDLLIRGLSVGDPDGLIKKFQADKKANIVIRNQPHGQVDIKKVEELPKTILATQPDGSVKELPDPRDKSSYSLDMIMTIGGQAQITKDGVVLGNEKIKIGVPVRLEGFEYEFNASVIGVRTGG